MPSRCKEREKIFRSGNEDVPVLPLGAVRGRLCFRCFEPSTKILKCGACRRTGYCSKECQKLDWTAVHKRHCKLLQQVNESDLKDYKDKRTWGDYRTALLHRVRSLRDTTSDPGLVYIVQRAQPYCSGCYRNAIELSSKSIAMEACSDCKLAHHCEHCQDQHPKTACLAYQELNGMEQFRTELFEDTGRASVIECTQKPRTKYKALSTCESWHDYFSKLSDKQSIKDCINQDFSGITLAAQQGGQERKVFEELRRKFLLMATEVLTMPLTILSALEALQLTDAKSVNIHLLGATSREFLSLTIFEEILHLVPNFQHLEITAVGPSASLFRPESTNYSSAEALPCCPACQSTSRTRTIASYKGLYHEFATTSSYRKPTLIVAFNSGFVDGDDANTDWADTIRLIAQSNVPALFTTYNAREAQNEKIKMNHLGTKFIVEPTKNKWRSLVMMPELLDDEYGIWQQNDHWYLISGSQL